MGAIETLPRVQADAALTSIKEMVPLWGKIGAALYAALCTRIPEEPELVEIVSHGLASGSANHLFVAVHFLLLGGDRNDPLARYYATLTEKPAPPEEAFPDFVRFCKKHREELLHIIKTRTIQATTVERCKSIMPLLSHVAQLVGEPLNLIEVGCSAGVLLTFDRYAYEVKGYGLVGAKDAPLTFKIELRGGPKLHIPRIGTRIGLDLRPVDVRLEDERRWLLAQFFPEWRAGYAQLATALDVVTRTDIDFFQGDALDLLPEFIAKSEGPLCIYHSACVMYWSTEAKVALNALLLKASRDREFYRVGIEPSDGQAATSLGSEISVAHYRDGTVDNRIVARLTTIDNSVMTWLE